MSASHVIVFSLTVLLTAAPSYAQECQPMEAEASRERARLQAAVEYIEALNVAQARMQRQDGRYVPLNALVGLPSAPVGFIPRLLVDQWSYVVSLKDYFDACGFALFSDERGVIYETHARPATRQGSNDTADEQ